jgi:hypothetical protein
MKLRTFLSSAALLCLMQLPLVAQAGVLEVFGDVNSMSDGSAATSRLLTNLLGSGTSVLESQQISGDFPPAGTFSSFYSGLPGVTATLTTGTITSSVLSGIDLLFLNMGCCAGGPANPYSAAEIAAMTAFLNGGGSIGLLTEPCYFDAPKAAAINAMLASFGSTISIVNWTGDSGIATSGPSPLAAGVVGYFPTTFAYFQGGDVVESLNGKAMVMAQTISAVPAPATLALLGFGLLGFGLGRRKQ